MNMNCDEIELVILDYLENTIEESYRTEIEKHLASCGKCHKIMTDLQTIFQTISAEELEQPDETMRINFYQMLQSEINKNNTHRAKPEKSKPKINWSSFWFRIAAGIALILAGAFLNGIFYNKLYHNNSTAQLDEIKTEVKDMKKMLLASLLEDESPSQRIKAISYTEEIASPDAKVLQMLIHILNHDKDVNVKLAAACTLEKFSDNLLVRDSLVESLGKQTEPLVQVVLMNILTEKKELQAVKKMNKIINDKNTLEQVKVAAQKNIKVLL